MLHCPSTRSVTVVRFPCALCPSLRRIVSCIPPEIATLLPGSMAPIEIGTLYYVEEAIYKAEKALLFLPLLAVSSKASRAKPCKLQPVAKLKVWSVSEYVCWVSLCACMSPQPLCFLRCRRTWQRP